MNIRSAHIQLAVALIAAALFAPFLGGVHLFDWDEINFAESAREMLATGDYMQVRINFQPFHEKPPLFIWMQALSMKIFGVGAFAARFPNAVCGVLTLLLLFRFGKFMKGKTFGLLWVLAYAGSVLPHFYFRSGIIDPWFNLFIFLSLYFVFLFWAKKENALPDLRLSPFLFLTLAGLFNGMAVMTKGPVGLLLAGLTLVVYWAFVRFRMFVSVGAGLWFILVATAPMLVWYGVDLIVNDGEVVEDFFVYQIRLLTTHDAGHRQFLLFHFVVVLFGCFPASIPALVAHRAKFSETEPQKVFRQWMVILLWVVLVLFTVVKTKIVHYSSMAYFPVTFLAAWFLTGVLKGELRWRKWMSGALGAAGSVLAAVLIGLPFLLMNKPLMKELLAKDKFARANMDAPVEWTGFEALSGLLVLAALVWFFACFRKGSRLKAFVGLFGGTTLAVASVFYLIAPKIEPITQGAAIAFWKKHQEKDAYLYTLSYKSYAHYFYGRIKPHDNPAFYGDEAKRWLLTGAIDKDAYFSTKIHKADQYRTPEYQAAGLQELYEENGFVFFRRRKHPPVLE